MRKRLTVTAVVVLGAVAAVGCEDPVARRRSQARVHAVQVTAESLDKRESQRPKEVSNDVAEIGVMLREHEKVQQVNLRNYNAMWQYEVLRWEKRKPEYAREAKALFDGDIQRAHDIAVQFID